VADLDFSALFKQAQALQDKLKQMQEAAAAKTVEADAGGGMVRVVVDGSLQIRKLEIEPVLLTDKQMMQDLIVVAVNDGLRRAQEMVAQEVGKLSPFGGLKIPGLPGNDE
jgi:DNA-binding YbaB/EbfC family protein